MKALVAACDGSSLGNPGPSGWAWVVAHNGPNNLENGGAWAAGPAGKRTTNNVAELMAVIDLLENTDPKRNLKVKLDSQYVLNTVTKWRKQWRANNWKLQNGKPVQNLELVQRLDKLLRGRVVNFVWVKAHQKGGKGDPYNEFVDKKARDAAKTQQTTRHHK